MPVPLRVALLIALMCGFASAAVAQAPAMPGGGVTKFAERRGGGRVPFSADTIALQMARGELEIPQAGEEGWEAVERREDGSYPVQRGAYAAFIVMAEEPATMILRASGHGTVYVNGEPRPGDNYSHGYLQLPVRLQQGQNLLLFHNSRGPLRAELLEPPAEVFILEEDQTAPGFLLGMDETLPLGAVVVNATEEPITAEPWTSTGEEGEHARIEGTAMTVPAMSVRKVVFPVHYDGRAGENLTVMLGFGEHEGARREVELAIREPGQTYRRTFLSRIDGSVQYYAVQPRIPGRGTASPAAEPSPRGGAEEKPWSGSDGEAGADVERGAATASPRSQTRSGEAVPQAEQTRSGEAVPQAEQPHSGEAVPHPEPRPALVVSLHGASVEATGQARSYAPKTWCDIIAATNRRPFGFDWEDWGRIDALEALEDAMRHLNSDPSRIYLTGHSMGGHGVWSIGTLYPDRFAAIAPSAGWLSFATYTGGGHPRLQRQEEGVPGLFARAVDIADTSVRLPNLRYTGIYILHGTDDDNVPVREARDTAERLRELGIPFHYHEQPDVKHWWRISDEPGAEVVDWPGIFDLFARTRLPRAAEVREVSFVTVNPAVSGRHHWARIVQQAQPLKPSRISLRMDPHKRRIVGETENVAVMAINVAGFVPGEGATVELDGQSLEVEMPEGSTELLLRRDGEWTFTDRSGARQDPFRAKAAGFRSAFDNDAVLVYGTRGTAEETAWARSKARYDAESFYYRGNGSLEVLADVAFDPAEHRGRNVIIYGNARTHEDWQALLGACPIELTDGSVRVGDYLEKAGEEHGTVFCYPRQDQGSGQALVGVVGGTGLVGMRLTDRLPYFTSGVHYPDWTVFGPEIYEDGYEAADAAGYFDNAWQVDPGNSVVRETD